MLALAFIRHFHGIYFK